MECKTHIVCANALTLAFVRPDSITSLLVCIGAATVGSTISDIDISTKKDHSYVNAFGVISIISLLILGVLELVFHIGINDWINNNSSYSRIIICLLITIGLCYYGFLKPHRSFLHSFLGIFLLSLLCYISLGNIVIPFMIGIISHIILDLFNIKGLMLFYPLKKKYSLKLCKYNGVANKYLFIIFSLVVILELIIYGIII